VSDATAPCPLCDTAGTPDVLLGALGFLRCPACGFVYRTAAEEQTRDVYEGGEYQARDFATGYAVDDTIEERRRNARVRVEYVRRFKHGGALLDVGAAGGAFVLEAGAAGFTARGVEPSPEFARHARETLGVDVADGRLEDAELDPGSLDVITLWHVLEHIPDPVAALRECATALRRDGVLVLEVPNLDSAVFAMMGTAWTHLDPDVHVSQFTSSTLADALARADLRPLVMETVAIDAYLTRRERLTPAHLAHRAKLLRHGLVRAAHPRGHELLRAVARPA
jgi:2-polyprenyl-3-methyl-5-hydroxy-6-metoxy-1,4-benzoquinol methylase